MTQNLIEILTELPKERRYHTVLDLLSSGVNNRLMVRNLGLDVDEFNELLRTIPAEFLSDTLDYFEGTDSVHYAHEMIAQIEGARRNDANLIKRGAEFLEQHGDLRKAGYLYERLGGSENIRNAAECHENHARKFTPEYIEIWGQEDTEHEARETWKDAGKLWESIEEWKRGSICYENAAIFEGTSDSSLSHAIYLAEKYDVDRAIDLAIRTRKTKEDAEGNSHEITIVDEDRAPRVAARAGRYEQAISLAPDDAFGLKMQIAEMCERYEDAVAFAKQIDHDNFQIALKHYEKNPEGSGINLDYRTNHLFGKIASLAKKAGMKETEDKFYGLLIRRGVESRDLGTAEDLAFEAERWEDFARVRLERFDDGFSEVYNAVIDGSHTDETELFEKALADSQREGFFRTTAMIASYLGKEEQVDKFRYLGMITSR